MRCIAHMWSSTDCDGNHFLLCLSPLCSILGGAPVEAFTNKKSLALRLAEIGCKAESIVRNIAHLGSSTDDTWSYVEVPLLVFEGFGKRFIPLNAA